MTEEASNSQPVTVEAPAEPQKDRRIVLFLISALIIVADRLTKDAIVHRIRPGYTIPVIPGFFHLSHVLNTGAAFSLMENWPPNLVRIGLVTFSVAAALVLLGLLWRTGKQLTLTSIALALIFGGALGNLYDRIRFHHVVDFLAVTIYHYHWPDFNVADSAIVVGACLLLLEIFRPDPNNQPIA
ncbi:MAG TPA: signal peptidase II [Acidobacteriaceae bacterium]|nr:signal peptidase II [Acidobacteriaceae bacterium]